MSGYRSKWLKPLICRCLLAGFSGREDSGRRMFGSSLTTRRNDTGAKQTWLIDPITGDVLELGSCWL